MPIPWYRRGSMARLVWAERPIWSSWPLPCKEKEVEARTGRYQFYRHDITLPLVLALYSEGKHDATPSVKVWAVKTQQSTQDNKMHMWLFRWSVYKYINMGQSLNMVTGKYYNWLYVHFSGILVRKLRSHYTLIDSAKCTMSCHCVLKLLGCTTPISA